jgi:hypothetical protein
VMKGTKTSLPMVTISSLFISDIIVILSVYQV